MHAYFHISFLILVKYIGYILIKFSQNETGAILKISVTGISNNHATAEIILGQKAWLARKRKFVKITMKQISSFISKYEL